MPDCSTCRLFTAELDTNTCMHVNRPGGLELTRDALVRAKLPAGSKVADIASGLGETLACMSKEYRLNPIGIDISNRMLRQCRNGKTGLKLIQADCTRLPFSQNSLQAIMMECALSLSGDPTATLSGYYRALLPDGMIILSDIYIRELRNPLDRPLLDETHCLAGAKTETEITKILDSCGFSLRFWEDQTTYLKRWMASMVFQLGSLRSVYSQLIECGRDPCQLENALGQSIKLGYYLAIAGKTDHQ